MKNKGNSKHNTHTDDRAAVEVVGQDVAAHAPDPFLQLFAKQDELGLQIAGIGAQYMSLCQHMFQSLSIVIQKVDSMYSAEESLRSELGRFQTGGPQHAMAAIFTRLTRDLLGVMNDLDNMVELATSDDQEPAVRSWGQSLEALRHNFEQVLAGWGCTPMLIREKEDQFDPELHQGVEAEEDELEEGLPGNVIVKLRRRGWKLHDSIIQYPQVVVS